MGIAKFCNVEVNNDDNDTGFLKPGEMTRDPQINAKMKALKYSHILIAI